MKSHKQITIVIIHKRDIIATVKIMYLTSYQPIFIILLKPKQVHIRVVEYVS